MKFRDHYSFNIYFLSSSNSGTKSCYFPKVTLQPGNKIRIHTQVCLNPKPTLTKMIKSVWKLEGILLLIYSQHSIPSRTKFHGSIFTSLITTVVPPYPLGNMFQDPQWLPETKDNTKPHIHYVFSCTYQYIHFHLGEAFHRLPLDGPRYTGPRDDS